MFPGLGWGVGAFVVYLAYEAVFLRDAHASHGDDDGHHKSGN